MRLIDADELLEHVWRECTRQNLCVDCDNERCWHHGKLIADCPKYHCDRPPEQVEDCETCAFLKRYQEDMRRSYDRRKMR